MKRYVSISPKSTFVYVPRIYRDLRDTLLQDRQRSKVCVKRKLSRKNRFQFSISFRENHCNCRWLIIVTNHKFAPIFEEWAAAQSYTKPITIIDDGTESNDTRLGAVCDLLYAIDCLERRDRENGSLPMGEGWGEALLVVAADNLLFFSFREFVDFAMQKGTSCIMCHHQPSVEKLQRTGVIVMDDDNRVINMEEKLCINSFSIPLIEF